MKDNDLTHYGVLGMKWGVRRTPKQLGHKPAKRKTKQKSSVKDVKRMSDDELRKAVNRLQLERQYSQLSKGDITRGKQYAQNIFKAGTTIASVTGTALAIYNNIDKIKTIIEKANAKG
jgi:hypothetical protein